VLRTLLEEVNITVERDTGGRAELICGGKGAAISDLAVPIKRKPPKIRADEDIRTPVLGGLINEYRYAA